MNFKKTIGSAALAIIGIVMGTGMLGCQSQRTFATPDDAVKALATAADHKDSGQMHAIFGPRTNELRSGDPDQDALDLAAFKRAIAEARQVDRQSDDYAVVLIGNEGWPFAVPLVRSQDGWRFDTAAGIDELENRRIGRNEIFTIAALRTLVDAQNEYHRTARDGAVSYAKKLMSTPGKQDGLYWESEGGVDPSPIGPLLAQAASRRDDKGERLPYFGYNYRLMTRQGAGASGGAKDYERGGRLTEGWAVIAWPDVYDKTGVMSFIVNQEGVIYEQDLGPETEQKAQAITEFDPSAGWRQSGL